MSKTKKDFLLEEDGLGFTARFYSDLIFTLSILNNKNKFLGHVSIVKRPDSVKDLVIVGFVSDGLTDDILQKLFEYLSVEENWNRYHKEAIDFAQSLLFPG